MINHISAKKQPLIFKFISFYILYKSIFLSLKKKRTITLDKDIKNQIKRYCKYEYLIAIYIHINDKKKTLFGFSILIRKK